MARDPILTDDPSDGDLQWMYAVERRLDTLQSLAMMTLTVAVALGSYVTADGTAAEGLAADRARLRRCLNAGAKLLEALQPSSIVRPS